MCLGTVLGVRDTVVDNTELLLTWSFYCLRDLVSVCITVTNFGGVCKPFREKGNYVPIADSMVMMQVKDPICLRIITGSS